MKNICCVLLVALAFCCVGTIPAFAQEGALKDDAYLALVDQAIKDPSTAKWGEIRDLYKDTSFYNEHGGFFPVPNLKAVGTKAVTDKTPQSIASFKKVMRDHFGNLGTHMYAYGVAVIDKPTFIDAEFERKASVGLTNAILATGDGLSMDTAWHVISIEEQYSIIRDYYLLQIVSRSLEGGNGHLYDVFKVKKPKSEHVTELFFNADVRFQRRKKSPLGQALQNLPTLTIKNETPAEKPPLSQADTAYLTLVDQAMKNPAEGKWDEMRDIYPDTTFYQRVGGTHLTTYAREIIDYVSARNTPEAIAVYKEYQREHFLSVSGHKIAEGHYIKSHAPYISPSVEKIAYRHILDSVLRSGDGLSPSTAFKIISAEEAAYFVSHYFHSTQPKMYPPELIKGQVYSSMDVPHPDTKKIVKLYFRMDMRALKEKASP